MQCWPLATHALYVKRATVNFETVASIRRIQRCGCDAEARPHSYAWPLMVQLGLECHDTVALEVLAPKHSPQMIRRAFFLLAFLHTVLWPQWGHAISG